MVEFVLLIFMSNFTHILIYRVFYDVFILQGSDLAYLTNLHTEFDSHPQYVKGEDKRNWEKEFGIVHYAGTVTYNVTGFVDKNRDVQQDVFFDFLSRSKVDFVQELTAFQVNSCSVFLELPYHCDEHSH